MDGQILPMKKLKKIDATITVTKRIDYQKIGYQDGFNLAVLNKLDEVIDFLNDLSSRLEKLEALKNI